MVSTTQVAARQRVRGGLYRLYLRLCRTPLSPSFLMFFPLYRRLVSVLNGSCSGLVLDVGSGMSPFYRVVRGQGARYISLDYPMSSELAPFGLPPPDQNNHVWGDARQLPFKDGSCHVVICTSVLEHVTDPAGVLREVFRVLQLGGRVVGSVPFGHNLHMEPFDYYRISEYGLRNLARELGFHVTRLDAVGKGFHAVGACTADILFRSTTGLKRSTMSSMGAIEMVSRLVLFLLVWPVILAINLLSPLADALLPSVQLPTHYVFVCEKRAAV